MEKNALLKELVDKLDSAFPLDTKWSNEQWVNDIAEQSYGFEFALLPQHQQEFIKSYVEWNCKHPDADDENDSFYMWMCQNGHPTNDFID